MRREGGRKVVAGGKEGKGRAAYKYRSEELRGGEKGANQLLDGGRKGGKGKVLL